MLKIFTAEFYLTHHCNLDCEHCNRFSNYKALRGHRSWQNYAAEYQSWANNLDIDIISILGGEPLMHPDILEWMQQIRSWWPKSSLYLMTNGTLLNRVSGLYDAAKDYQYVIDINVHNPSWYNQTVQSLDSFFPGQYTIEQAKDDPIFSRQVAKDHNGVEVHIKHSSRMHQSTVLLNQDKFHLHQSDPVKAHSVCWNATCHHFFNGKLFKCAMPPLLKEFSNVCYLDLSEEDRALIDGPSGITVDDAVADPDKFYQYLKGPIEHCRLCPEELEFKNIAAKVAKTVIPIQLYR
jgi:organic radical activating enzyme